MPVIAFANSKGGVGKSTTALALAQVFAKGSSGVTLIDADPNQPLARWAAQDPDRIPDTLAVLPDITEETIVDAIDTAAARNPFVLVDLEGSANVAVSYAIGRADLVIVPMRGSQLDADQAARVIKLVERESKAYRRTIPYVVIYTCTSPALRSRGFRHIDPILAENGIPVLAARWWNGRPSAPSSSSAARSTTSRTTKSTIPAPPSTTPKPWLRPWSPSSMSARQPRM